MKKAIITATASQALKLASACETAARLMCGQWATLFENVVMTPKGQLLLGFDVVSDVESLVKPYQGLAQNSYYGVGHNQTADILWEMYKTIRSHLAWNHAYEKGLVNADGSRNFSNMMGVHYDEPMPLSGHPFAAIEDLGPGRYKIELSRSQFMLMSAAVASFAKASHLDFSEVMSWPVTREGAQVFTKPLLDAVTARINDHLEQMDRECDGDIYSDERRYPFDTIDRDFKAFIADNPIEDDYLDRATLVLSNDKPLIEPGLVSAKKSAEVAPKSASEPDLAGPSF